MNTVRKRWRRVVASVMLAAMAAFILHAGGAASPSHGIAPIQQHAGHHRPAEPADRAESANLADGAAEIDSHARDRDQDSTQTGHRHGSGDEQQSSGAGVPCCHGLCASALALTGDDALSAPLARASLDMPANQLGSGIDTNGLKRPPRTPYIA